MDYSLLGALAKRINTGRCFVLVGAGPSCEMGYPRWHAMCDMAYQTLRKRGLPIDAATYEAFLGRRQYPELLQQVELDLRGRTALVDLLREVMVPTSSSGGLYKYLARWPFACYLTTNYDDEISNHLKSIGTHYTTLLNHPADLRMVRSDARRLIVKLHGSLAESDGAIITSNDYHEMEVGGSRQYFRQKLEQVFGMTDVFVVGQSLTDPDLRLILKQLKDVANPEHPIYMTACDVTLGDIRELRDRFNIHVIDYNAPDGDHRELHRAFRLMDRMIASRGELAVAPPGLPDADEDELSAATGLFLFRKLDSAVVSIQSGYWDPMVLKSLSTYKTSGGSLDQLLRTKPLSLAPYSVALESAIQATLGALHEKGLIDRDGDRFMLRETGMEAVSDVEAARHLVETQALGQFVVAVRAVYPVLTAMQEIEVRKLLRSTLVSAFRRRGLALSRAIFANMSLSADGAEVFSSVSKAAATIRDADLRAAFVEQAWAFLVSPTDEQKEYLAAISQGYFLFHLIGQDPECSRVRREVFSRTVWFFDSSVLIPFVAKGCHDHAFAADVCMELGNLGARVLATPGLIQEVWEHLEWAANHVRTNPFGSPEFLSAALVKEPYKQNLFIDGYVRTLAAGGVRTFGEYIIRHCKLSMASLAEFQRTMERHGVQVYAESVSDPQQFEAWVEEIRGIRLQRSTFRSELQVRTEAEMLGALVLVRRSARERDKEEFERAYFVSPSSVLDEVFSGENEVVTWSPESLYRYVKSLPGSAVKADLLQECMLQEYFYAGVSFVDQPQYVKVFGVDIAQAKLVFAREKEEYLQYVEAKHRGTLEQAFEQTPDLDKPYFVSQMAWKITLKAREDAAAARERAVQAERKASETSERLTVVEKILDGTGRDKELERLRQEVASLRNRQDARHVRKRMRQAKKRRRKKKA